MCKMKPGIEVSWQGQSMDQIRGQREYGFVGSSIDWCISFKGKMVSKGPMSQ